MELEHNFTVAVPVERAWEVLLDLERIAPCAPGATLTSVDGDEFAGNVRVKLGPVTMTFTGRGRFLERDPQARRIVAEASGKEKRGSGTARGKVTATLQPDGAGGTEVAVRSEVVVTGRLAQFGRGMIVDVSNQLLGQFTDCLSTTLAEPTAATTGAPEPAPAAVPEAAPAGLAPGAGPSIEPVASASPAREPAAAVRPGPAPAAPIDLLGVTGVRAAAGRVLPYLLTFLLGVLLGGGLVALLTR